MTVAVSSQPRAPPRGTMLSARKQLDVSTASREVGSYRGASAICSVTHKTVRRIVEKEQAQAEGPPCRRNYGGLKVFGAVLAFSRVRFVRLARGERAGDHAGAARRALRNPRRGPRGRAHRPDGAV